ncbi:MAG: replication factor C large subunit [Candidatus Micrarchaeota archaeon]
MLYTVKYAPKKLDAVIGNEESRETIKRWMLNWINGDGRRPLLISGPPGIGKTTIAYVLASQYDLEIIEMSASELRNKERVEKIITTAAGVGTLSGNLRVILIDDVDIFIGRKDTGGLPEIVRVVKEANCPIILTATDVWDKKLAALRAECERIEMKKVSRSAIKKLIAEIAKKENLLLDDKQLDAIAENSAGDVRSALVDLQAARPSARDRDTDMFTRVRTVFKATTYKEARSALNGDVDYDLLKLWIDENIPEEYERNEDLVRAYFWLSRADIFQGRTGNGTWILLKYALDLMTAGVALAKEAPYRKFTKYQFPAYLRQMGMSVARRAMVKSIGLKVGHLVHTNYKDASAYFFLLSKMPTQALEEFYQLDEDEIKFIKTFSRD